MLWFLGAGLAFAAIAYVWLVARKSPFGKTMKDFARALTRSAAFRDSIGQILRERSDAIDAAIAAPPPADVEIPGLVHRLMGTDELDADVAEIHLTKAGSRAVAELLLALGQCQCVWTNAEGNIDTSSPAGRVVQLLWESRCRQLGERIGYLWDHPDWQVYRYTMRARAALGEEHLSDWAISILNDDSENASIKHDAIAEGIERSIEEGWAAPEFTAKLLAWAEDNLTNTSKPPSKWAAEFFAAHGGPRALQLMQSDRILTLANDRTLHFVLKELNKQAVLVSPDLARQAVNRALDTPDIWPWPWVFKPALIALARAYPDEAMAIAESSLNREDGPFRSEAIDFIREQRGFPQAWEAEAPEGMTLRPDEAQLLLVLRQVSEANGQIGNGGLSQYFFNSSGDYWERDAMAFEAVGDPLAARTLRKASNLIAAGGASNDRKTRMRQYANLPKGVERKLDSLNKVFWGSRMDAVVVRFMLQHADLLRRVKEARKAAVADEPLIE
jgi:hypothetical protein